MRNRNWNVSMSVAGLLVAFVVGGVQAKNREPGAMLMMPKQEATVERSTELFGKVLVRGWPIALVRADERGSLWWVQEPVERLTHGRFKVKARFGNDKTSPGTAFRVIVLMAQSEEDVKLFEPGSSLKALPSALPCSVETVVVLGKQKEPAPSASSPDVVDPVIVSPKPMSQVTRIHSVEGRVPDQLQPIVLVRSAVPNSPWWVQGQPKVDEEGEFQVMARFGSESTPAGTEFRIVVLLMPDGPSEEIKAGMVVKELPPGVRRTAEIRVVLTRPPAVAQSAGSAAAAGGD